LLPRDPTTSIIMAVDDVIRQGIAPQSDRPGLIAEAGVVHKDKQQHDERYAVETGQVDLREGYPLIPSKH